MNLKERIKETLINTIDEDMISEAAQIAVEKVVEEYGSSIVDALAEVMQAAVEMYLDDVLPEVASNVINNTPW